MLTSKRAWIIFLLGAGLTLLAAGMTPLLVRAQEATPAPEGTPEPVYPISDAEIVITGDNSYCLLCHNQPLRTITLPDGSIQNLYVNADNIAASVHGTDNPDGMLGCIDCHGADSFPHDDPTPADSREYTLEAVAVCAQCHQQEAADLESGLHENAIRTGNRAAAVCTDCHGAHDVRPVVEHPELIAGVCGDCHTSTLAEWRISAHADLGPLGCGSCHSPHRQTLRVGTTPNEVCMNCHEGETLPALYVHVTHDGSELVGCTDCHMHTDSVPLTLPVTYADGQMPTGHSMLLDTAPCTTCHENLVASGEWDRLVSAREGGAVEAVEGDADVETRAETESAATTDYVELLQGLLLGVGFGVTFAAVFITRGNRPARPIHTEPDTGEAAAPHAASSTPPAGVSDQPPPAGAANQPDQEESQ